MTVPPYRQLSSQVCQNKFKRLDETTVVLHCRRFCTALVRVFLHFLQTSHLSQFSNLDVAGVEMRTARRLRLLLKIVPVQMPKNQTANALQFFVPI
jgi:phosphoribulokinase